MPLSQIGSLTNQIQHNHISMPISQRWSYMRTHIRNPTS
ncbi:hypothetical protein F383_34378 [Gossypium arboreum]|uniref:Uncharacterized protein n=1 Tax=Gossypium arboreum TaxID=29729 RepID=A0A0B0N9I0_GOSAR|nr:hypothetical protein F383_34378 [Gossypium arboreum]